MAGHDFEKEVVRVILNTEIVGPRSFKGLHNPIYLLTYPPTGLPTPTYRSDYPQVYLPIYLQVYVQTYPSVPSYLSIYFPRSKINLLCLCLPTYLQEYLPSYIQIYQPTCRSRNLPTGQRTYLPIHPSTYLYTHQPPTYLPTK